MAEPHELGNLPTIEHVGQKGWRIRVCLESMEALIDIACLGDKLRGAQREDLALTLERPECPECHLEIEGRIWLPELLAKVLVLKTACIEDISALYSDLSAARNEAVRAIIAGHGEVIARIGPIQDQTMALLEEDLSYRVPQEVN